MCLATSCLLSNTFLTGLCFAADVVNINVTAGTAIPAGAAAATATDLASFNSTPAPNAHGDRSSSHGTQAADYLPVPAEPELQPRAAPMSDPSKPQEPELKGQHFDRSGPNL